jgi:hypothetical protein
MGRRYYVRCKEFARNGFVYDASFQSHHKKPGVSPMQRDPKNVGGGGKTAQKPTSFATPLYVTSAAATIQWMFVAERVSRYEYGCIGHIEL